MIVLVTGGTRGIGRGIAARFHEDGHTVVVCARRPAPDCPFETHLADVRDPEHVQRLVAAVVDAHGRLDVVVNNAGGSPPADAATASPRFSEAILRLNLHAPLHVCQAANAVMQAQDGGGVLINVASVAALRPSPTVAAYGAAKAGLLHLTRTLAVEYAPRVRVVAVTPGLIHTDGGDDHYADPAAVAATIPLGRMGTPRDVAEACVWLASPAAAWISGAHLVVDGGGERPAFLTAQEKP